MIRNVQIQIHVLNVRIWAIPMKFQFRDNSPLQIFYIYVCFSYNFPLCSNRTPYVPYASKAIGWLTSYFFIMLTPRKQREQKQKENDRLTNKKVYFWKKMKKHKLTNIFSTTKRQEPIPRLRCFQIFAAILFFKGNTLNQLLDVCKHYS